MEIKKTHIFLFCSFLIVVFCLSFFAARSEIKDRRNVAATPTEIVRVPAENPEVVKPRSAATETINQNLKFSGQQNVLNVDVTNELSQDVLSEAPSWKLWLNARVVVTNSENKASDVILAKVSNLTIARDDTATTPDLKQFSLQRPIAVFNTRLRRPGIITGTIKITTARKDLLENDLLEQRARLTDSFDQIQTYFVTGTDEVFDLEQLFASLKSKPYILSIELEVLNRNYAKK